MKKFLAVASFFSLLIACNSNSSEKSSETTTDTTTAQSPSVDISQDPAYSKGLEVVAKNDCGTCHEINEKKIGPPFHEVALRYSGASEAQVDTLANKVIKGGSGNWGTVAMTPHPSLSHEDAVSAVKYVLLLKNM